MTLLPKLGNLLSGIPIIVFLSCLPALHSENWNRFRGPNGAGALNTGEFPTSWTEKDYAWSCKLPGVGHSSPVLWGDKLFTTCASESTGEQFVLCLDAKSGKKLWQKNFPSKVYLHHKFNSFASATPCVDSEYVFVSWTTKESNDLLCLDHNGAVVWRRDFGRFQTQHGNGFSPVVEGEVVVVTHDHEVESSILCLDRKTGRTLWKTDRDGSKPSSSTPLAYRTGTAGKLQFVSNSKSHGCYGVDGRTGKVLWETGPDTLDLRTVSSPVFAQGLFFASCGSGGRGSRLVAIRPPANPGQSPQIEYVLKKNVPYVPTPLPFEDMLFLISDGGIASCLKTATGEVLWRERLEGNYFASPILVNGKACVVSREGEVRILSISSEKMKVLGLSKLNENTHNTPAVSSRSLFFRTYSSLHCLNSF
jgi:outer membrane protein assembly factor BamB